MNWSRSHSHVWQWHELCYSLHHLWHSSQTHRLIITFQSRYRRTGYYPLLTRYSLVFGIGNRTRYDTTEASGYYKYWTPTKLSKNIAIVNTKPSSWSECYLGRKPSPCGDSEITGSRYNWSPKVRDVRSRMVESSTGWFRSVWYRRYLCMIRGIIHI